MRPGQTRPQDGSGRGKGMPNGLRKNRNQAPCQQNPRNSNQGRGQGSGQGRGKNR